MTAIYNNTLTIDTADLSDRAALMELQKIVEGKSIVFGGGITHPEDSWIQGGVTLVLADDPAGDGEIQLSITPAADMNGNPVIKVHCIPCSMVEDDEDVPQQ